MDSSIRRDHRNASTEPRLTFFCELDAPALTKLLSRDVIDALVGLRAGVSLGVKDLSADRASCVRTLNAEGIPVTAWLLLPREQGYFHHPGNAAATGARYDAVREWSARYDLRWAGVGLDIEPDVGEMEGWARNPWSAVPVLAKRAIDSERLRRAMEEWGRLIARIRADGLPVETYQFPSIVDERNTGSRLLQRAFGMMNLAGDREVLMAYSSILLPRGPGWICSYGPQAQAIAVGSTGGGIDSLPKLTWWELERDLLLARRWSDDLYVFSVEGCVEQGMMQRLRELDWSKQVEVPRRDYRRLDLMRRALRTALVAGARLESSARTVRNIVAGR